MAAARDAREGNAADDLSKRDISEDIHGAQYLEGVRVSARAPVIGAFSTPTCPEPWQPWVSWLAVS